MRHDDGLACLIRRVRLTPEECGFVCFSKMKDDYSPLPAGAVPEHE
jgi:hypothetical protein